MNIISAYSLLPLLGSLFVIVLGFFVWFKKPKELLHILFFLYSFTISLWLFGTFKLFNATSPQDQLFWDRFIYIGVVFIPIFLYHFGVIYLNNKKQHWFLGLGYILAFIFLPFTQTPYLVDGLYTYQWGVHAVAKILHHPFLAYFLIYFAVFFVNLYIAYRHAEGVRKKQLGYMLIGFGILDVIGPFAFLPAYGIPVPPIIFLSAVPFALIVAYGIIKHNALEVKTITTEVFVTILTLISLAEVFIANTTTEFIFRVILCFCILIFSFFLLESVKKEIERRNEVVKLAESLEKANTRLQEIDRQKTEFLSIASHQLRTPLSIIKGYIELIKDGAFGKVTKKTITVLHDMDESNERLVKLVDEFLDITRIEQGRTKYSFKEESMHELIDSVIKELHDKAETKGLHIIWEKTAKDDMVFMDSEKIRHVVFNYVDNAIKYSPEGDITITFEREGDDAVLRVKDHGFGFNKEDEANFFQKFYRGKNVVGTNVNGTGLGIYVCRKFIEKHTGSVWAHSEGLGKGSEFGFRILMKQNGRSSKIEIDEISQEIIPQKNTETLATAASS